jgi:hypothetical protein
MKKYMILIPLLVIFITGHCQKPPDGLYAGLERIVVIDAMGKPSDYIDPAKPLWKWYHLTYIKVKGDSVFLDQSPISLFKRDTSYSASDGGFYYYSGKICSSGDSIILNLKQLYCDYCAIRANGADSSGKFVKQLKGKFTKAGFFLNGFLFKKILDKKILLSERPKGGIE